MQCRRQITPVPQLIIAATLTVALAIAPAASADAHKLPAEIDSGLGYLYEFSDPQTTTALEIPRLEKLIAFLLTDKADGVSSAGRSGAFLDPLAFHEFTVKRSLPFILEYAHNPAIPPQILTLGTVRFANWKTFDERFPNRPDIAERMRELDAPIIIRGLEHEEIAPDSESGAYYSYDLQRTLVGFRHGKHTFWISMSRQNSASEVGRKGYVLDEKNAWHYIYSGEKGIRKLGLGWVDSYMYEGFACNIFIQSDATPDQVKIAIFKWLRAGWNGMNFVKYKHIRDGLERYGKILRQILEHPDLPPPSEIEAVQQRIANLDIDALQRLNRDYLQALDRHYGTTSDFPRRWFKKEVVAGSYVEQLTRPQLESVVFLEYMNGVLGMHPVTEPDILLGLLQRPGS